jgi:hypothetical protein
MLRNRLASQTEGVICDDDAFQEIHLMTDTTQLEVKSNETYRHLRRGSLYTVVGRATLQTDRPLTDDQELIVYKGVDGYLWARPSDEFCDGRFQRADVHESPTQHD